MRQAPRVSLYIPNGGIVAMRNHAFRVEQAGIPVVDRPVASLEEERALIREKIGLDPEGIWDLIHGNSI
jgi:hypothetical protein